MILTKTNANQNLPLFSPFMSIIKNESGFMTGLNKCQTTTQVEKTDIDNKERNSQDPGACLDIAKIRKILNKFLVEKKLSKATLAERLGIATNELTALLYKKNVTPLIYKVNLPLIKLFCETKFSNSNNQQEEKDDAVSKKNL